ncbi:MAG TPA: molybdenum cofactor biosynthesis protein MoaE [Myxococcales bacterium]|nr:molybdenum cofactor biosynthesis protein MoaE [Myxococcales bacterium]
MRIALLFFAAAREAAGCARAEVELPEGATAGDAKALALARFPALVPLAAALQLAVDREISEPSRALGDGAEVALLPPVAGGSGERVRLTAEALSAPDVEALVRAPAFGAVVTFAGTVRGVGEGGRRVVRLEYEAYAPMALRQMAEVIARLEATHGARMAVAHRVGALAVGDVAVVVCAGAPHREAAFRACEEGIAALKAEAAIWKREVYDDGSSWIGLGA